MRCQLSPGRVKLSIFSKIRDFCSSHFSKPSESRQLHRDIRQFNIRKIVELGIDDGSRAMTLIEAASQNSTSSDVHYVGMDPFEGRSESDGQPIHLKDVHQRLRATGARVQLVPGNPADSLIRLANSLGKIDLLIVPEALESPANARMWFFVPRMLHDNSQVYVERCNSEGQRTFCRKARSEIDDLASLGCHRRAA